MAGIPLGYIGAANQLASGQGVTPQLSALYGVPVTAPASPAAPIAPIAKPSPTVAPVAMQPQTRSIANMAASSPLPLTAQSSYLLGGGVPYGTSPTDFYGNS